MIGRSRSARNELPCEVDEANVVCRDVVQAEVSEPEPFEPLDPLAPHGKVVAGGDRAVEVVFADELRHGLESRRRRIRVLGPSGVLDKIPR